MYESAKHELKENNKVLVIYLMLTLAAGLEKLTNANRSVSSVNDRLFPVELTEIADWKSISEYMLHLNFGKALTGVIGAYTLYCRFPVY